VPRVLKILKVSKKDNKAFGKILEEQTKIFAISTIRLSSKLPFTNESKVIRNQLTKSSSSIGANYREANRSRIRRLYNKIKICESECNENWVLTRNNNWYRQLN
jgi:four helix bundle protein